MPSSIAVYPMADYHRGVSKSGKFHLVAFEGEQAGSHNRYVPHRHDFFEIFWMREGRGRVRCDLQTFEFGPKTLLIVSPGQVHAWEMEQESKGVIASFTPEFLAVSNEHPGLLARMPFLYSDTVDPILNLDDREAAKVTALIAQFDDLISHETPGRDDIARSFIVILLSLARQFFANRNETGHTPRVESDLLVQRFRLALEENLPELVEVGEYAELLNVSRSHLNDGLRRHTGRSASEIIHDRVLLEAKRMLLHSSLTIAEIAYQLRFQDPSYFGRFFRKYTGCTPGSYREAAQLDALAS